MRGILARRLLEEYPGGFEKTDIPYCTVLATEGIFLVLC
jgi:hypothetical protein